jgi:hypothetical protein
MFAELHSDINSLKSGLLYLTGQPYYKQSRSAKVKDGIINLILRNYLIDLYIPPLLILSTTVSYTSNFFTEMTPHLPQHGQCVDEQSHVVKIIHFVIC